MVPGCGAVVVSDGGGGSVVAGAGGATVGAGGGVDVGFGDGFGGTVFTCTGVVGVCDVVGAGAAVVVAGVTVGV